MGDTRDTAGFDTFYTATARRVLHHVYAVCGDLGDAQDVVQEAYARAWQRWSTISVYEDPEGWVRLVAWRLAASRWRAAKRRLAAFTRHGPSDPVPGPGPDRVAVIAAVRALPEAQRRVVVLHYLYEQPVADIAASLGMPVGTVKSHLHRARTALAAALGEPTTEKETVGA
ncbi:SigE family RNA polymerase sigma factor [Luedemannella flava]|uniref:SigE family RNA polymerase sigma factor n=1 Tax=Luedemannella flava TaxID=349316 RepID=A0ABP4XZK2_9ACTN